MDSLREIESSYRNMRQRLGVDARTNFSASMLDDPVKQDTLCEYLERLDDIDTQYETDQLELRLKYRKNWRPQTTAGVVELGLLCLISGGIVLPIAAGSHYLIERRNLRRSYHEQLDNLRTEYFKEKVLG